MGGLFSRHKTRVTEQDKAVLQLKRQRDELQRFARRSNDMLDKDTAAIKELVRRKQQSRALLLLKKKKYREKLLERSEYHLTTVESLISDLEFAQAQRQVLESLQKGNEALRQLNNLMKLEDVEKILSTAQEAQDYQAELSALISGNLTPQDNVEVEAELSQLLGEDTDVNLPTAPHHDLPRPSPPSVDAGMRNVHKGSSNYTKSREAVLATG